MDNQVLTKRKISERENNLPKKQKKDQTPSLSSIDFRDILEVVFQHVGVYDTIWNARRVCKEWKEVTERKTLAARFVELNNWTEDYEICKQRNEHNSKWEHCFKRVTVNKFYEKVQTLISSCLPFPQIDHDTEEEYGQSPLPEIIQRSWNNEMKSLTHPENDNEIIKMNMPWHYMEFVCVFNGLNLGNIYDLRILDKYRYVYGEGQDQLIEGIHSEGSEETAAWIVIADYIQSYEEVILCCDKDHPDFGKLSIWTTNCGDGYPFANNCLEMIRGLYFRFTLPMNKFNFDSSHLRTVLGSDDFCKEDFFEIRSLVDDNGEACTDLDTVGHLFTK